MAFISLGSKLWGTGPDTTLNFSYEKKREGADMKYRIKISVEPLPYSESYFGYPIYMKTSLAGTLVDTHTVKDSSPSQWSSAIEYITGWFTVKNKTSGTTALSLNVYSGNGNSRNKTYSYSLAVDPAGSALGTISNFTIGNAIDIPITKYDSNFTDTLEISVGGTIVKTISGITSGYDVSFTSSELSTIYSKMPNVTSAIFTFKLTTKSGSTTVGTSTKTATGTISSTVVPSISSITVSEAGSVPSSWGVFVKNKSKLKFVISGSAGSGSSISSVKTTINGSTYSGSTITTNLITTSGDITATITITDSRGRSSSTTKTISVWNYGDPYITTFNAFRCDADGNKNDKGTNLYVSLKGGFTSLGGRNTPFSYAFYYKKTNETTWKSHHFNVTTETIDTYVILSDIEGASSYNIFAEICDYFKAVSRELPPISSVFRTMNFKAGGRAVGIGKIAEIDGVLDVGLATKLSGGIYDTIRSTSNFNRGSWGVPTKGIITQVTDNSSAQHSPIVGLASDGATRIYGIDFFDSDTSQVMRLYAGSNYLEHGAWGFNRNGNTVLDTSNYRNFSYGKIAQWNADNQIDPNTTDQVHIITRHANAPTSADAYYVHTYFYNSTSGNRTQVAYGYQYRTMYIRRRFNDAWSTWLPIPTQTEKSINANSDGVSSYVNIGNLLICWGRTKIKPTTANTPIDQAITFPKAFNWTPVLVATAGTGVPGTQMLGVGQHDVTPTGAILSLTRTNTTATSIDWIAIGGTG